MANDTFDFLLSFVPDKATLDKAVEDVSKALSSGLEKVFGDQGFLANIFGGKGTGTGGGGGVLKTLSGILSAAGGVGGKAIGGIGGLLKGLGGSALGSISAIGAAVGPMALGALEKAPAAAAKGLVLTMKTVSSALHSLDSELGPISLGFDALEVSMAGIAKVIDKIPVLGQILGPAIESLGALPAILKDITSTLTGFAAKASPATLKLFTMAVDNVKATIGQAFLPVLNLMTQGVRLFGQIMANILPNVSEVNAALTPMKEAFGEVRTALREALIEIGPIIRGVIIDGIRSLGDLFKRMVPTIKHLIDRGAVLINILENLWEATSNLASVLSGLFLPSLDQMNMGLSLAADNMEQLYNVLRFIIALQPGGWLFNLPPLDRRKNAGTPLRKETPAAREGKFQGFEEYEREFQQSALAVGANINVPEKVSNINDNVDNISNSIDDLPTAIADALAGVLQALIPGAPDLHGATQAVKEGVQKHGKNAARAAAAAVFGGVVGLFPGLGD